MGYVENNLIREERIIYKARIHWFIYSMGIILIFLASRVDTTGTENDAIAALFLMLGIAYFLYALIIMNTTELVITNKRVIGKFGFIRRDTIEILHQKIESVKVSQGIFGRIFNYGDVIIQGSGGASSPIKFIRNPTEFRKKAMEYVDIHFSQ